jgi:hypothetical protein
MTMMPTADNPASAYPMSVTSMAFLLPSGIANSAMTLVVSDSAGAVIAPKSIKASSNPHHDRFAMPRRSPIPARLSRVVPAGPSRCISADLARRARPAIVTQREWYYRAWTNGPSMRCPSVASLPCPGGAELPVRHRPRGDGDDEHRPEPVRGKETADPVRSGGRGARRLSESGATTSQMAAGTAGRLWGAAARAPVQQRSEDANSPRYSAARPDAGGSFRPGWRAMPAATTGRYQRAWTTVPLCSVTTFLALPVQSMKAGRSCQVSTASLQCSTTPAGDS